MKNRHTRECSDVIFFFQAEDGIRDIGVTGVQTCALPIWPKEIYKIALTEAIVEMVKAGIGVAVLPNWIIKPYLPLGGMVAIPIRSEERRVGKECRSRWSPYH